MDFDAAQGASLLDTGAWANTPAKCLGFTKRDSVFLGRAEPRASRVRQFLSRFATCCGQTRPRGGARRSARSTATRSSAMRNATTFTPPAARPLMADGEVLHCLPAALILGARGCGSACSAETAPAPPEPTEPNAALCPTQPHQSYPHTTPRGHGVRHGQHAPAKREHKTAPTTARLGRTEAHP